MYRKGEVYINESNQEYRISGIWWKGFNPSSIELMRVGGGPEYIYSLQDFENAIEAGKLKEKKP